MDKVIQTLNKIGLNTKDSTMKHNNPNNNSNNNSSKAQSINSVTMQPNSSSNAKKGLKKKWKPKPCRFCRSRDHTSTYYTQYLTPESRITILRSRHGSDICHKCTSNNTGRVAKSRVSAKN